MALTLRGNGQVTSDNYTIDSDGDVTAVNAAISGTLGVTGDATFDTSTLKVDAANNRVGIGTTSPTRALHVDHATDATMVVNAAAGNQATYLLGEGGASKFNMSHKASDDTFQIYNYYNSGISLKINSSGHVTTPNQPAFMAHKNGNQALTAHTLTKITSWTENTDQSNSWDNTNARFTAPTAGIYLFGILMQSNILGGLHCMIRKNGSNGTYGDNYLDGGNISGGSYTLMMPLAVNDYVEYLAYLTANGNINANRSKVWAVKVG